MKKGNSPLINGIILGAIAAYLTWYFSVNGMWNPATVIVVIIMALMCAGQIIIWNMYFRVKNDRKTDRKGKKQ